MGRLVGDSHPEGNLIHIGWNTSARAAKEGELILTVEERIVAADLPNHLGWQSTENDYVEIHDKKNLAKCAVATENIGEYRFVVDFD